MNSKEEDDDEEEEEEEATCSFHIHPVPDAHDFSNSKRPLDSSNCLYELGAGGGSKGEGCNELSVTFCRGHKNMIINFSPIIIVQWIS